MASLQFTQSIAAGATFDPLDTWNYQYLDKPGIVKLNHNATAVGLVCTFTAAASQQVFQESPVPAGGTSGVIPSDLTVPPVIEQVPAGRVSLRYRNPTGGAIIVNGNIDYTPRGGGRRR